MINHIVQGFRVNHLAPPRSRSIQVGLRRLVLPGRRGVDDRGEAPVAEEGVADDVVERLPGDVAPHVLRRHDLH
eukprot:CAMPEP_0115683452 /NCGR_PEP_ID=MMETSP0272-20121206/58395_1 /TAXON_ID=71861 /ORGANISM="Scrippsiella trochoidea, Strain CCMP3099" /LENGTH=73 /DNA_ID=CAMNT_0003122895 /DNA_START=27 /DNA_END=245 /DNA_ORIENTATION=+